MENKVELIFPPNEAHAMGFAVGSFLATGKSAVIFMQNSGLNNIANAQTSLNALYKIPVLLVVSWRGEPGRKDAPEHDIMGKITKDFLKLLEIPALILSENWEKQISKMINLAKEKRCPTAAIIRDGFFEKEKYPIDDLTKKYPLSRLEAMKIIKDTLKEKSIFISTNGFTSRDSFAALPTPDFYMMGSMGHAFSIGAGFSSQLGQNSKLKTVIFDGDGGSLMHLGSLAMVSLDKISKSNLLYILLDNEAYESTGSQPTLSSGVNFAGIAEGLKFPQRFSATNKSQLIAILKKIKPNLAAFVHIKINRKTYKAPRVSDRYTCEQITERFMKHLHTKSQRRSANKYFRRMKSGSEMLGSIKEYEYEMPTRVIFGRGSLREISEEIKISSKGKIVIVAGEHFKNGRDFSNLRSNLIRKGCNVVINRVRITKSNFSAINQLADFCRKENPSAITAIGGGTIIDTAKCAAVLTKNEGRVEDYVREKTRVINNKGVFLVAIPTTAGTGSEVTPWATVWDEEKKDKYSLTSLSMFPDLAIVDPSHTDSLPPKETAESGVDALAQGIEAYWSVRHNLTSDKFALDAIRMIMENLMKAVKSPDIRTRNNMAKASLLSGLAFSNTQTTICHSVSYPMTANYGINHGQAVAITLPLFIVYSFPVLEKERRRKLLQVLSSKNGKEAAGKIEKLMRKIGLKTKLSELGIKEKDIDLIVEKGFHPDRAENAPRIPTPEELRSMLLSLL